MTDRVLEMVVALVLAAVGLVALVLSLGMPNPLNQPMGPGSVPTLLATCTLIVSGWNAIVAWRSLRRASPAAPARPSPAAGRAALGREQRWALLIAFCLFGVVLWTYLGPIAGLAVATFGVVLLDQRIDLKAGVAYAIVVAVTLWLFFEQVLGVSLG
jgi:hypothetical protein